jgi:asparagine synthase (glutamine-hydrolysing)
MSGIVGVVHWDGQPVDVHLFENMTQALSDCGNHRPRTWINGNVALGHVWLQTSPDAIHENQPFSGDQKTWIVADARIDGRIELVEKLRAKGRSVNRQTPAAHLIWHAYGVWRDHCVDHLIGDFAFAIWDKARQTLFCARDHFGIKPFYYARLKQGLIFASTIDAFWEYQALAIELNESAVGDFLLFGYNTDLRRYLLYKRPYSYRLPMFSDRQSSRSNQRRYWTAA